MNPGNVVVGALNRASTWGECVALCLEHSSRLFLLGTHRDSGTTCRQEDVHRSSWMDLGSLPGLKLCC
eukprot:2901155-Amphidinium_carterae.1